MFQPSPLSCIQLLAVLLHEGDEVLERELSGQLAAARIGAPVVDPVERVPAHLEKNTAAIALPSIHRQI